MKPFIAFLFGLAAVVLAAVGLWKLGILPLLICTGLFASAELDMVKRRFGG